MSGLMVVLLIQLKKQRQKDLLNVNYHSEKRNRN